MSVHTNPENTSQQETWQQYFSPQQWVFYAVLIVIGVAFRWYALDMRPVHHDESQHGMFGRYFFDAPEHHFYRYNPMLHGPLLYNLYRLVYNSLGSDLWSFRAPMAFLGSLFIVIPFLFRRWISPRALLFLTAALATGPSLIYWSRFAREDFYVLTGLLCMLIGASGIVPRLGGGLVIIGLSIQLCCKANIFVHVAIILGFLIFEVFFSYALKLFMQRAFTQIARHGLLTIGSFAAIGIIPMLFKLSADSQPDVLYAAGFLMLVAAGVFIYELVTITRHHGSETLLYRAAVQVRRDWQGNIFGLFIATILYTYLYTAGGRHSEGFVAGLGGEAISYWLNQHAIERIAGPFMFQFYTLTWYELPFTIAFFIHLVHFYTRDRARRWIGLYLLAQSILLLVPFWLMKDPGFKPYDNPGTDPDFYHSAYALRTLTESSIAKFLGIKDYRDLFGATILCLHPLIVTAVHLIEKRRTLALWGYLFTSFFFTYSYLKEKVPWLSMYPLIVGLIYLTLYFDSAFRQKAVAAWQGQRWSLALYVVGSLLLILGFLFIGEGYLTKNADIINESTVWENSGFLAFGIALVVLGFLESRFRLLGSYNLVTMSLLVLTVYNVRLAFITNVVRPGHASEYISQVHTTPEFHEMVVQLRQKLTASIRGQKPLVLGKGESTWPITWYMAGVEGFHFDVPGDKKLEDFDYIFDTWSDSDGLAKILPGYTGRKLEFRGWWVPDFNSISFKRFLRYAINHTNWSPTGFTYVLFMSKDSAQ